MGQKELDAFTACWATVVTDATAACYTADAKIAIVPWDEQSGRDAVGNAHKALAGSFKDLSLAPQLVAMSDTDVFAIVLVHGTQTAPLKLGTVEVPSKGKTVGTLAAIHFVLAEGGAIASERWTLDLPALQAQLAGTKGARAVLENGDPKPFIAIGTRSQEENGHIFPSNQFFTDWNARKDVGATFAPGATRFDSEETTDVSGPAIQGRLKEQLADAGDVQMEPTKTWAAGPLTISELHRHGTDAKKRTVDETGTQITRWDGDHIQAQWTFTAPAPTEKH